MIAPFRLGLTATLERTDGLHHDVDRLVGPVVYRKEITELSGIFLAEYRTELIEVRLEPAEQVAHDEARATFRSFCDDRGLRLGGRGGWSRFLREAARSAEGARRSQAGERVGGSYKGHKRSWLCLSSCCVAMNGRCIVFTNDNETVYAISRRFLLPAITHQTGLKERQATLAAFSSGALPAIVTSRVLNEGVDLPSADVAIVLSGTGTVREHVQRLGRILRRSEGKQAVLYEVIVQGSSEERTSARRREHDAYR